MSGSGLYFAYGANMEPAVLARRGVRPLSSEAAWVDDYSFDFGVPGLRFVDPAFATVRPQSGARVHGVLHRLSTEDLARLDGFETDQERFEVTVGRDKQPEAVATTYRSFLYKSGGRPSRRYLSLLVGGARRHELPKEWIDHLIHTPSTHIPVLSTAWTLVFPAFDRINRLMPQLIAPFAVPPDPKNDVDDAPGSA